MTTYWPTGPIGWTCQVCGGWVPNGTVHHCGPAVKWTNPPPTEPNTAEERIAAALERIAVVLERNEEAA